MLKFWKRGKSKKRKSSSSPDSKSPKLRKRISESDYVNFDELYTLDNLLGQSEYGRTYLCVGKDDGIQYACKSKDIRRPEELLFLKTQLSILEKVDCRYLCSTINSFSTSKEKFCIIMEYVSCSSMTGLQKYRDLFFTEEQVRAIIYFVLKGLCALHSVGIIHLDLRYSNILLSPKGYVKLSNISVNTKYSNLSSAYFAHEWLIPPEVILYPDDPITDKIDIWGVGITIIQLLKGVLPGEKKNGVYPIPDLPSSTSFPSLEFDDRLVSVTTELRDFLSKCLSSDPHSRPSAKDLLSHPFLKELYDNELKFGEDENCKYLSPLAKEVQNMYLAKGGRIGYVKWWKENVKNKKVQGFTLLPSEMKRLMEEDMKKAFEVIITPSSPSLIDVQVEDFKEFSELKHACEIGDLEKVKELMRDEKINKMPAVNLLVMCARKNNVGITKVLLNHPNCNVNLPVVMKDMAKYRITPLYQACSAGSIEICKFLLDLENIDLNIGLEKKRSALDACCRNDNIEIGLKIYHDQKSTVSLRHVKKLTSILFKKLGDPNFGEDSEFCRDLRDIMKERIKSSLTEIQSYFDVGTGRTAKEIEGKLKQWIQTELLRYVIIDVFEIHRKLKQVDVDNELISKFGNLKMDFLAILVSEKEFIMEEIISDSEEEGEGKSEEGIVPPQSGSASSGPTSEIIFDSPTSANNPISLKSLSFDDGKDYFYFGMINLKTGKPHGLGHLLVPEKKIFRETKYRRVFSGNFCDGMKEGTGRIYETCKSQNGKKLNNLIFEGNFRKGEKEGAGNEYDKETGNIMYKGLFQDGKRSGKGEFYDKKSQKFCVAIWENGRIAKALHSFKCQILPFDVSIQKQLTPENQIGSGGIGQIYKVKTKVLGTKFVNDLKSKENFVAVKVTSMKSVVGKKVFLSSVKRSLELCSRLENSRYILPIYAILGKIGYVMQLCECSVDKLIRKKSLSISEKIRILEETAAGINELHKIKVMHRDLKWGNILLSFDKTVKITDYDSAREDDKGWKFGMENYTQTGIGTPSFVAPEICTGKHYGLPVDVYSFGLMIHAILFNNNNPYNTQKECSCGVPCRVMNEFSLTKHCVDCGFRPKLTEEFIEKVFGEERYKIQFLIDLMIRCWDCVPLNRPTMKLVCEIFKEKQKVVFCNVRELSSKEYIKMMLFRKPYYQELKKLVQKHFRRNENEFLLMDEINDMRIIEGGNLQFNLILQNHQNPKIVVKFLEKPKASSNRTFEEKKNHGSVLKKDECINNIIDEENTEEAESIGEGIEEIDIENENENNDENLKEKVKRLQSHLKKLRKVVIRKNEEISRLKKRMGEMENDIRNMFQKYEL